MKKDKEIWEIWEIPARGINKELNEIEREKLNKIFKK